MWWYHRVVYRRCVSVIGWLCFFVKQKTAYEMRISDWSSDVCSSDLAVVCVEAAFHFNTREKFLAEALRVLKPGGHLVLSDILISQTAEGTHQRRISDDYVPDLAAYRALYERAGFTLEVLDDATEFSWRTHFIDRKSTRLNSSH